MKLYVRGIKNVKLKIKFEALTLKSRGNILGSKTKFEAFIVKSTFAMFVPKMNCFRRLKLEKIVKLSH